MSVGSVCIYREVRWIDYSEFRAQTLLTEIGTVDTPIGEVGNGYLGAYLASLNDIGLWVAFHRKSVWCLLIIIGSTHDLGSIDANDER